MPNIAAKTSLSLTIWIAKPETTGITSNWDQSTHIKNKVILNVGTVHIGDVQYLQVT